MQLNLIRLKRDGCIHSFKTIKEIKKYWHCFINPHIGQELLKSSLTYDVVCVKIVYNTLVIET